MPPGKPIYIYINCKTDVCTQVKQRTLIPTVLEAGSLRSCGRRVLCLVGPASWLAGDHLSSVSPPVGGTALVPLPLQFSSVSQSCPTLCDPVDCRTPGLPAHHQLPEFTQTRVHWVGDAIQPSHPLSSPSPLAFNLFQHQGLFK